MNVFCNECKYLTDDLRCDSPCNLQIKLFGLVLYGGVKPSVQNMYNDCVLFERGKVPQKESR